MTENTRKIKKTANVYGPKKRLIHTALICTLLTLTGCNGGFPSFPGFDEDIPQKPKSAKTLKKEVTDLREKSLQHAGLNSKNLFGKNIRSTDDRINRLERAVQDMRNEFDGVKPSIERLTALETEIQTLVRELQTLNQADFMAAEPVMVKPQPIATPQFNTTYKAPQYTAPAPTKSFQKKSAPPLQGGKASVYDVRIGEHPGRTRIVIDVNSKTPFNVDVDNNERIMVVDLPQAGWNTATVKSFARSPFVSSYKVETSGQGHILILQLKRNARVSYQKDLKGFSGHSRRLVIDLSA